MSHLELLNDCGNIEGMSSKQQRVEDPHPLPAKVAQRGTNADIPSSLE